MDGALYVNPQNFRSDLIAMRQTLGITQADMARELGMSLRAYNDLETGKSEVRQIHIMAAERLTLFYAYQQHNRNLLGWTVRRDVEALTAPVAS